MKIKEKLLKSMLVGLGVGMLVTVNSCTKSEIVDEDKMEQEEAEGSRNNGHGNGNGVVLENCPACGMG